MTEKWGQIQGKRDLVRVTGVLLYSLRYNVCKGQHSRGTDPFVQTRLDAAGTNTCMEQVPVSWNKSLCRPCLRVKWSYRDFRKSLTHSQSMKIKRTTGDESARQNLTLINGT